MNESSANISLICEALQVALQIATGAGQNAARSGPVAGPGTTPHTQGFKPPGGPIGPLHSGLTLPPLATAQGRAHLYITQPELVRQVEDLLDSTAEKFHEEANSLLCRLDEERTRVSPLVEIATQLQTLTVAVNIAIKNAQEEKESFRQDVLRLQESFQRF